MATTLRLDYDQAKAQAEVVMQQAERIDQILKDLVKSVDENINNANVWTGESAQEFKGAWDNCADNFNAFVNHVKSINQKIDETQAMVRQADTNM